MTNGCHPKPAANTTRSKAKMASEAKDRPATQSTSSNGGRKPVVRSTEASDSVPDTADRKQG